ncbi:MAG TPA: hypothetical protein VH704_04780 [Casimicrobiaceae bacterium]|jgi:hypothetical protein|nr:hypothetical protein [Casimicrobiaceae bacterium]
MTTRIAVLGLYRSGSSAAAGVLHHLGVEMGAPYWMDNYESARLARRLRRWWHEPDLQERFPPGERVRKLRDWISFLEAGGATHIGAKHPLLSLCGEDLVEAWGPGVRFIWTWRPLDESIASIRRTGWWPEPLGEKLQHRLWDDVNGFFAGREHLRVDFSHMVADPAREIRRIADYVDLLPDNDRFAAALASIRPERTGATDARRTAKAP